MSTWMSFMCQDPASLMSFKIVKFHDFAMWILIMIMTVLLILFYFMVKNYYLNRLMIHGHLMEIIWTIIPIILLLFLAFPSLKILYMADEFMKFPSLTIKVVGHQWYWSYEYSDFYYENVEFDSYMLNDDSDKKLFRLLDVDNRMIVPYLMNIRLMILSDDVIHSWAVPSLGLKVDAVPGRMNQLFVFINRLGLFFGQCSEICGVNHSFMPIVVESTKMSNFLKWLMHKN